MQATETELASANSTVARETWLTTCCTHTEPVNLPGNANHADIPTLTAQLISSISAWVHRYELRSFPGGPISSPPLG